MGEALPSIALWIWRLKIQVSSISQSSGTWWSAMAVCLAMPMAPLPADDRSVVVRGAALLLDRFHLLGQQGRLPGIGGIRSKGHGKELSGWRGRYHLLAPWQRRRESLALSRCESCASLP